MNANQTEHNTLLLQLQKEIQEAHTWLTKLKEGGYDLNSPEIVQANMILELKLDQIVKLEKS